jgi:pilus assembly protein CpaB
MNQRVTTILLLALVISGGATFLVYRAIRSRGDEGGPPHTQVVLAARTLEIGTLIKDSDIQMGAWNGVAPPGMVAKKDGLIGRGVIAPVYAGEPVMETRLAAPGMGGGLAATIPPGMRAVAVKVNEIIGVAGFVQPGMRVDVLITGLSPGPQSGGNDNPQVKTILQNIEVLSAGSNYQKNAEGKPDVVTVVNLLVNPEQAEILTLSNNETKIQLILRNPLDTESTKPPGTAKSALFGGPPQAAPARPRAPVARAKEPVAKAPVAKEPPGALVQVISAPPYQIQIFNGEKQSEAKFPRPAEGKK